MARYVKVKVTENAVKSYLHHLIDDYGYNGEIETFGYCSDYGIDLEGSTIDKIVEKPDGDYTFFYNENTGDCDTLSQFNLGNVFDFAREIKKACLEEEEIAYAENYGEGAVARLG